MKILIFLHFILLQFSMIIAQPKDDVNNLEKSYEKFQYATVVNKADILLRDKERFSNELLIQIYTLKAASHFAISDQESARKSFIELLKINSEYILNDIIYSPKLVDFFNSVKTEFLDIIKTENRQDQRIIDSVNIKEPMFMSSKINGAIARSLVLPGWGHLYLNENTKGWILSAASSAALGTMIYFIFDANKKERDYLTETNHILIQQKYNDYNKSYKIRNILIVSYAVIWLYSQIDILFFSQNFGSKNIYLNDASNFKNQVNNQIEISLKIPI